MELKLAACLKLTELKYTFPMAALMAPAVIRQIAYPETCVGI